MAERPLGLTIICILGFIMALLYIVGSAYMLLMGGAMMAYFGVMGSLAAGMGGLLMAISILALLLSIAFLISLVWLWQMKRIGWAIAMVLNIILIIIGLANFNVFGVILALIIVIYLYVKRGLFR